MKKRIIFLQLLISSTTPSENIQDATTLENLDDYALLDIFELLPHKDLFNLAVTSARFRGLIVSHILIREYHVDKEEVRIDIDDYNVKMDVGHQYLSSGYNETIQMLQVFRGFFSQLKIIYFTHSAVNVEGIVEHINKYCSQAKQEIFVHYMTRYKQNAPMNIPFENVSIVYLMAWDQILSLPLHQLFPRMQKLGVTHSTGDFSTMLDHHFSHLNQFRLRKHLLEEPKLYDFIRLNPQIRQIDTQFLHNYSYFQQMSDTLHELESLHIENYWMCEWPNEINEIARFSHVKKLKLSFSNDIFQYANFSRVLPRLQFDQLDTLSLEAIPQSMTVNISNQLIDFITQFKTLTNLKTVTPEWSYSQLTQLIEALPQVKLLTFKWYPQANVNEFRQFLSENYQIDKITVTLFSKPPSRNDYDYSDEEQVDEGSWCLEDLQDHLPIQWKLNAKQGSEFELIRIQF